MICNNVSFILLKQAQYNIRRHNKHKTMNNKELL